MYFGGKELLTYTIQFVQEGGERENGHLAGTHFGDETSVDFHNFAPRS